MLKVEDVPFQMHRRMFVSIRNGLCERMANEASAAQCLESWGGELDLHRESIDPLFGYLGVSPSGRG